MIQQERRLNKRKPLASLAYISMPPDNGGIVLDLSEGGLGFHTVVPVVPGTRIPFRFSMDSLSGIQAVGELAWRDESGRTGGLRFIELPPGIREIIREWAGQETSLAAAAAPAAQPALEPVRFGPAVLEPETSGQPVRVEIFESKTPAEELLPEILESQIAAPEMRTENAPPELPAEVAPAELDTEIALPELPVETAPPDVGVSPEGSIEIPLAARQLSNSRQAALEIPVAPLFIEEIKQERIPSVEPTAREPLVVEAIPALPADGLRPAPYTAPDYSLSMFPSEMAYQDMVERAARPPIYVRHPIAAVGAMILAASVIGATVFGIMTAGGVGAEFLQWVRRIWYLLHSL